MQKVESQESPQILSFSIICPQWLENSKSEDTESLLDQVLCYIDLKDHNNTEINKNNVDNIDSHNDNNDTIINSQWIPWSNKINDNKMDNNTEAVENEFNNTFSLATSNNEIVKQIGLLQAITDISCKFNGNNNKNTQISYIDTDKTRTIIGSFESQDKDSILKFWFFCQFQFTKIKLTNGDIRYIQRGLATPEYLKNQILKGYQLWCLNNGSLENYINQIDKFNARLEISKWWRNWFINKFEFPSSFDSSDDALFNILHGIRYSCVDKPVGFLKNLDEKLKNFIDNEDCLNDILILNTNWTPEKNWGVIYMNNESIYSFESLNYLISFFKDIDLKFGLSTYALTYGNWPSLKQYVNSLRRMKSIKPNGGLFERSLMEPAIYLQEKLTNNVFNPFTNVIDTVESYIPSVSNLIDVNNIMPSTISSINTVKNATLHPWNSLASYWNSNPEPSVNNEINNENNNEERIITEDQNVTDDNTSESRSNSRITIQSNLNESLEIAEKTGSFLLGLSKKGSIILHDFNLYNKITNEWEIVKLIIYELNGILFVLFYDSNKANLLNSVDFYTDLSTQLNLIYETYFTDLIFNQLKTLENDMLKAKKKNEEFSFIIYDDNKYWTNISNIPPDNDTLLHQIPEKVQIVEQNIDATDLEYLRTLSLMQDRQLQGIIINNLKPSSSWIVQEKIIRLGRNNWCLFHRFNEIKWVIVIKRLANVKGNEKFIFGEDVKMWLTWVENNGYM